MADPLRSWMGVRTGRFGRFGVRLLAIAAVGCLSFGSVWSQQAESARGGTPVSRVEREFADGEFPPLAIAYGANELVYEREYTYAEVQAWSGSAPAETTLVIRPDPTSASCWDHVVRRSWLNAQVMVGAEDYKFGPMAYDSLTVSGVINARDTNDTVRATYQFTLTTATLRPETAWRLELNTGWLASQGVTAFTIESVTITPLNIISDEGTRATTIAHFESEYRLRVSYSAEVDWSGAGGQQAITNDIENVVNSNFAVLDDNPLLFTWIKRDTGCQSNVLPNYQLQLLRLFNREHVQGQFGEDEYYVADVIDWRRALTVEIGSDTMTFPLTIAEGRGYYLWRVRPIGNLYPGGIGNDRNYGEWSVDYPNGAEIRIAGRGTAGVTINGDTLSADQLKGIFFHTGFEPEKNWIYSRSFSEGETGTRVSEKITFATGLLRERQSQVHLQSQQITVGTETYYDYSGRPAIQTLAAPTFASSQEWGGFDYDEKFVQRSTGDLAYTAEDFDANSNANDPATMFGQLAEYYSTNADLSIPSAEGYPFSRALYLPDADSRVREQGGAGSAHRIGGSPRHTVRTMYEGASEPLLVAMFGREAPSSQNVRAVYTTDPNDVTSVQYVDKAGQTLASFLVSSPSNAYQSAALEQETPATLIESLTDTIRTYSVIGSVVNYTARVSVPIPGAVNYAFKITPATLELCGACTTCDYRITLEVVSAEDPADTVRPESVVADLTSPTSCWPGATMVATPDMGGSADSLMLDRGTYLITLRIYLNNPSAAAGAAGRTIAEIKQQQIGSQRSSEIETTFYGRVRTLLDAGDLTGLYAALDDPYGVGGFLANEISVLKEELPGDTAYVVTSVGSECWSLRIPVLMCETAPCDPRPSFEQMLYDRWGSELNKADEVDEYFGNHFNQSELDEGAPLNGYFDLMIAAMIDSSGYSCDTLLMVWSDLVNNYGRRLQADASYDLLDEFLDQVGRMYKHGTQESWGSVAAPGYRSHPYLTFQYGVRNYACENAFGHTDAQTLPSWPADQRHAPASEKKWESFAGCLASYRQKPADESILPEPCKDNWTKFGDCGGPSPCIMALKDTIENRCRSICQMRTDEFRQKIRLAWDARGYRIEGDTVRPNGDSIPPGWDSVSLRTIECQVQTLLERCEANCTTTIDSTTDPDRWIFGTPADSVRYVQVYSMPVRVAIPNGTTCDTADMEYISSSTGGRTHAVAVVAALNTRFATYRASLEGTTNAMDVCAWVQDVLEEYFPGVLPYPLCQNPYTQQPGSTTPIAADCCPNTNRWEDLFALGEHLAGEFRLNGCQLVYHRVCQRNGVRYEDDVVLYNDLCTLSCGSSLCFKFVEETPSDVDTIVRPTCEEILSRRLSAEIERQIQASVESAESEYREAYIGSCLNPEAIDGAFVIKRAMRSYHFTLFYYDRAGHLVKTVPPAGVRLLFGPQRTRNVLPPHVMTTVYTYNSLGQLTSKTTPDGGLTTYYYDDAGRLRFSQNAQQAGGALASYTKYDHLSRVIEVGQSAMPANVSGAVNDPSAPVTGTQRVFTYYSGVDATVPIPANGRNIDATPQRYVQNRVAHVRTDDGVHTQYSYDPHGNVEWVRQELPVLGRAYTRYEYDLVSGKVLRLSYNEAWRDRYFHRYRYDEDGRIIEVLTSRDDVLWTRDARYSYYAHGPLKRVVYGEDSLQGVDYAYTIHGWLKAINHPSLDTTAGASADPGSDGFGDRRGVAADAFGMMLGYYQGDFIRSGSGLHSGTGRSAYHLTPTHSLYNGNIGSWTSHTQAVGGGQVDEVLTGYTYYYDVLNRLINADYRRYTGGWGSALAEYSSNYKYDPNGNLRLLFRGGTPTGGTMDSLRYFYTPQTNRLRQIQESVPANRYAVDIDNQSNTSNYTYDAIGNLIGDVAEGITNIEWSVYGKVLAVWKNGVKTLDFLYDGAGHRVRKRVNPGTPNEAATYYAYEAGGNVLAIYEGCTAEPREPVHNWDDLDGDGIPNESDPCPCDFANACDPPPPPPDDPDFDGVPNQHDECPCESAPGTPDGCPPPCPTSLRLAEWHIYGSSAFGRFAVVKPEGVWRPEGAGQPVDTSEKRFWITLDEKYFELKDHLGNVRVVVTDVKKPAVQSATHPYVAVVASYNNYDPYGMLQPERSWQADGYRYGFNGKEMDNEVKAVTGGSYDYGARMYDARVGRWMSRDPLSDNWSDVSPFVFSLNSPSALVDPDGATVVPYLDDLADSETAEREWRLARIEEIRQFWYDVPEVRWAFESRACTLVVRFVKSGTMFYGADKSEPPRLDWAATEILVTKLPTGGYAITMPLHAALHDIVHFYRFYVSSASYEYYNAMKHDLTGRLLDNQRGVSTAEYREWRLRPGARDEYDIEDNHSFYRVPDSDEFLLLEREWEILAARGMTSAIRGYAYNGQPADADPLAPEGYEVEKDTRAIRLRDGKRVR